MFMWTHRSSPVLSWMSSVCNGMHDRQWGEEEGWRKWRAKACYVGAGLNPCPREVLRKAVLWCLPTVEMLRELCCPRWRPLLKCGPLWRGEILRLQLSRDTPAVCGFITFTGKFDAVRWGPVSWVPKPEQLRLDPVNSVPPWCPLQDSAPPRCLWSSAMGHSRCR